MSTSQSSSIYGTHAATAPCGALAGVRGNAGAPLSTAIDLDAIRRLQMKILAIGPAPSGEFRIHPADLDELKRTIPTHYPAPGKRNYLNGLELVIDPAAPRLPRMKG